MRASSPHHMEPHDCSCAGRRPLSANAITRSAGGVHFDRGSATTAIGARCATRISKRRAASALHRGDIHHVCAYLQLVPSMLNPALSCCRHSRRCWHGNQVVITAWEPELPAFSAFEQRRSELWQRPAWARGVLVDDDASLSGPPLHVKLQHVSSQCSAIDALTSLCACNPSL